MDHATLDIERLISYPVVKTTKTQVLARIIKSGDRYLVGLHRFYTPEVGQPKQSKGVYFPLQAWENFLYFLPRLDEKVQALLKELPKKQFIDINHPSGSKLTTTTSLKETNETSSSTSPQKASEASIPLDSREELTIERTSLNPQFCAKPTKRLNADVNFLQAKFPRTAPTTSKAWYI